MEAAKQGDTAEIKRLVGGQPELLTARRENGESPLMAAMYYGKPQAVEMLLTLGAAVNVHEAAALGDGEYMAYLLQEEPEQLSAHNYDGWTPLHLAAFFGGEEAAAALIELGADVNARSANRMANTPLHAAVAGRKFHLAHLLLQRGADPNARQEGGWTALQQAAGNCDTYMARLLLDHGADPGLAQDSGLTALAIAEMKGCEDVAALLRERGGAQS